MTTTDLRADVTRCRLDRQQTRWMPQNHTLRDDKRKELRTWMRKKQRERLAVYQKHRESLREREHKPFSTAVTVVRTSTSILCQSSYLITFRNTPFFFPLQKPKTKNLAAIQRMRVEKETYVQFRIVCTRGKKS